MEKDHAQYFKLIKFSKQIANSFAKTTIGWKFLDVIRGKFKILSNICGGAFSAML